MEISFDPAKNAKNIRDRGLSFEQVAEFDFQKAIFLIDDRQDYGEIRYIAVGYLHNRLHILCFTQTLTGIRVISFRKANPREAKKYGKSKTLD
ncbi:MAG: BrnT family toxin [Snowella sp.]|nr:BrnT family toxin [Snowella sp.]